jgi:hypothetical protein
MDILLSGICFRLGDRQAGSKGLRLFETPVTTTRCASLRRRLISLFESALTH